MRESINEFLNETSVHGFKYLTYKNKFREKLFWTTCIVIGITGATGFVYQMIIDSYENPVLTTIDSKAVSEYPFPAITIDAGKD